jgi:hypothetical protein
MFGTTRENGMWIIKYNGEPYTQFKDLALNSRHYNVPDMYEVSLQPLRLIKRPRAEFTGKRPVRSPGFKWEEM